MKILVLSSLYPNNMLKNQGVFVEERMVHVSMQSGYSVKVVAPVPYYPSIKVGSRWKYSQVVAHEHRRGLEIFHPRYFMVPIIGMALHGWFMYVALLPVLKRIQQVFDFDMIDSHFVYPDGFAAVLLGRKLNKPVVVSARGSDINRYQEFPVIRRFLQYTLQQAHAVVAVSQALKISMEKLGVSEEKITVVPNGVDGEKFFPMPQGEARLRVGLPAERRVVLSVGHLTENKGFDLTVKAIQIMKERLDGERLLLVIIGEGVFRRPLESLIVSLKLQDCVRLVGDVPHQDLAPWYSAADVFCLASRKEGWPNVLLESLACGTPVVATAVGGIPEIIATDQVGVLVDRDEVSLARGLERALDRQWDKEAIGHYAAQYSWDRAASSLGQLFHNITRAPTTRRPESVPVG